MHVSLLSNMKTERILTFIPQYETLKMRMKWFKINTHYDFIGEQHLKNCKLCPNKISDFPPKNCAKSKTCY